MGQHILKKAFKEKSQAEEFRLTLVEKHATQNIAMHTVKSTVVEKYGFKMYSFNNKDIVNKEGRVRFKSRQPSRTGLLYPDKPSKKKIYKLIDMSYDYNILPMGKLNAVQN